MPSPITAQEIAILEQARAENLKQMFSGTKLEFPWQVRAQKVAEIGKDGHKLFEDAKKLASASKDAASTAAKAASNPDNYKTQAKAFIKLASQMDFSSVSDILGDSAAEELASECAPFVGIVMSGYKAGSALQEATLHAWSLYKHEKRVLDILPGDPTHAATAVQDCIKRMLAVKAADATRNTTAFAAKLAGVLGDGGTATTMAVGVATTAMKLIQKLILLALDYKDMTAGNELLRDNATLDASVFKVCPILGCHLIANSDTSTVLNFKIESIGATANWQDDIERAKKKGLDPILKSATKAIEKSNLVLTGLVPNKGTMSKAGFVDRQKAAAKRHFNDLVVAKAKAAYNGI